MAPTCFITGATGCVGLHLAEACNGRGIQVRALVRPGTDATVLEPHGVEIVRGDLNDTDILRQAVEGVDYVFHCAAKVGEWGPVDEYRKVNVRASRALLDACRGQPLKRFIYLGSLGVYPAKHHYGSDETYPLPDTHVDGYTITKVEAEKLALQYHRQFNMPIVVLRPGFVYGPHDRTLLPKLIDNLRRGLVRYIGSKRRILNCIFVKNLVHGFLQAMDNPAAVGQVYNLTDGETVPKKRFIESVCDGLELPRPRPIAVPLWVARLACWWMTSAAKKRGDAEPPRLTYGRLKFLGLNLDFSIDKARRELGYAPPYSFDAAMAETIAWFRAPTPATVETAALR